MVIDGRYPSAVCSSSLTTSLGRGWGTRSFIRRVGGIVFRVRMGTCRCTYLGVDCHWYCCPRLQRLSDSARAYLHCQASPGTRKEHFTFAGSLERENLQSIH